MKYKIFTTTVFLLFIFLVSFVLEQLVPNHQNLFKNFKHSTYIDSRIDYDKKDALDTLDTLKTLEEITKLANLTRAESLETAREDVKSQKVQLIRQKCWSKLTDFSSGNNLESSIHLFLYKALNLERIEVNNIRETPGLESIGGSGDPVFFITKNKDPILVVKALNLYLGTNKEHKENVTRELSSMEFMNSHVVSSVTTEKPVAIGLCYVGGTCYVLLAKTYCPGTMVEQLVNKLLGNSSEELFFGVLDAITKIGRTLGEVHSIATCKSKPDLKQKIAINDLLDTVIDVAGDKIEDIDFSQLRDYVNNITDAFLKADYRHSFCYSDASCANFLYDEKTTQLYLIDLSSLHDSLTKKGEPIGNPAAAVVKFEEKLEEFVARGLDKALYEKLKEAFYKGYLSAGFEPPAKELRDYFYMRRKLHRIEWGVNSSEKSEEKYLVDQFLFESALDYFREAIKK